MKFDNPHDALRHHVSGAAERGEAETIVEVTDEAFSLSITVIGNETDIEDRVVLALQAADIECFPESVWADKL